MNLTKTLGLPILGATLLFASCSKNDSGGSNNTPTCRINNEYYYENGANTPSDTAAYTYTGDKLTKMQLYGDDIDINLEYTGANITKRNYVQTGTTTNAGYDQITYNSDGTISQVKTFGLVSGTTYAPFWRTDFTYTSGKISKMTEYDLSGGADEKAAEYTYTFTGNNITQVVATDYSGSTPQSSTINFTYDGNTNYFKKHNAQAFILDPYLGNDGMFLPVYFSANNVTALSASGVSVPITYTADDKGNVKDVNLVSTLGQYRVNYSYLCQ